MAAQSCTLLDWHECWERPEFLGGRNPSVWHWSFDGEYIFRKFRFRREDIMTITINIAEGYCDQQSDRFLKSTPLLQVLLIRKYFASGDSFQDVCLELIGWFRTALFRVLRLSLTFCGLGFRFSTIIQEVKIARKKSKSRKISVQQTIDG